MHLYLFDAFELLVDSNVRSGDTLKKNEDRYELLAMHIDGEQDDGYFFDLLNRFDEDNRFPITNRVRREFKEIASPIFELKPIAGWVVLPPFYNSNTKLLSFVLNIYCKTHYYRFNNYLTSSKEVRDKLSDFNFQARQIFKRLSKVEPITRDEKFIINIAKLSILNLYLQLGRAHHHINSWCKLTLEEILYFLDSNYHENKFKEGSLANMVKNYLSDLEELDTVNHSVESYEANSKARLDAEACRFCPTKASIANSPIALDLPLKIEELDKKELYNQANATKILNVCDNTLLMLVKAEKLQKMREGKCNYYVKSEIDALKAKRRRVFGISA